MANLQDLVYSMEVGALRVWILRLAVLLLVFLLGGYYLSTQFNGLSNQEAMDQAQIARQISQGEGFTTKFIRPLFLKLQAEHSSKDLDLQKMPDLVHPPVYPYLLATAFKITGVSFTVDRLKLKDYTNFRPEMVIGIFNLVCFVLAVGIFYTWMIRAFDDRVAVVAALLFATTNLVWEYNISGLNVSLLLLFICALGLCLNEAFTAQDYEQPVISLAWLAAASLLGGLAFMTRYSMIAFCLALILVGGLFFRNRLAALLITIVIPLVISLPWFFRNVGLTDNIFGYAWVYLFSYDSTLWRTFVDGIAANVGLKQLITAMALGMGNQVQNLGFYVGGFLLPGVFFVSLFHVYKKVNVKESLWFWLAATLFLLVLNAPVIKNLDPRENLELNALIVLIPALAAFSAAFLFILVDRLKLPSNVLKIPILVTVILIQMIPLGINFLQRNPPRFAYPPYFPPVLFIVQDWIDSEEVLAADIPWGTAWYSDRTSLWVPVKKKDFNEINDFKYKISVMLLTPESSNRKLLSEIQTGEYRDWANLIKRTDLKDLPLPFFTPLPPNPEQDYIIFADRVRWK